MNLGNKRSYIWAVTRNEADWKELAVTAKEVSKQVSTLRRVNNPLLNLQTGPSDTPVIGQRLVSPRSGSRCPPSPSTSQARCGSAKPASGCGPRSRRSNNWPSWCRVASAITRPPGADEWALQGRLEAVAATVIDGETVSRCAKKGAPASDTEKSALPESRWFTFVLGPFLARACSCDTASRLAAPRRPATVAVLAPS
jgi:hypothetical protein